MKELASDHDAITGHVNIHSSPNHLLLSILISKREAPGVLNISPIYFSLIRNPKRKNSIFLVDVANCHLEISFTHKHTVRCICEY